MKWWTKEYEELTDKYMPARGEGETLASQTVTAVNKLVYKFYNDGDVFDTVHLSTCNDLSSYGNWLYWHIREAMPILRSVRDAYREEQYDDLLARLCAAVLKEDLLSKMAGLPKEDSIYYCDGPFACDDDWDDDDEDDYEDEEDEDDEDA